MVTKLGIVIPNTKTEGSDQFFYLCTMQGPDE